MASDCSAWMRSTVQTSSQSIERTAAWNPEPVPISSTFLGFFSMRSDVIWATVSGWEMVCPWPIGSAALFHPPKPLGAKMSRGRSMALMTRSSLNPARLSSFAQGAATRSDIFPSVCNQDDRLAGDALAPSGKAEMLCGRGLDADPVPVNP